MLDNTAENSISFFLGKERQSITEKPTAPFLGHLSQSGGLLVRRALTSSSQELLGQS